jgi:hypothetical protein
VRKKIFEECESVEQSSLNLRRKKMKISKLAAILTLLLAVVFASCSGSFIDPGTLPEIGGFGGGFGGDFDDGGGNGGGGGNNNSGSESNPIPLTAGVWTNGVIISSAPNQEAWYSITVPSGTTCYLWWNDSNSGNSTKTLDVKVSGYFNNGTTIFNRIDSGWTTYRTFTPTTGTVKIKVEPYYSSSTGTFGIVYSTSSTRPQL